MNCACGQPATTGNQCKSCFGEARKKLVKYALLFGAILSITCHLLPHDYRGPCKTVANLLSSC